MLHRKTYMYVNFQQNRVNKSVKAVHTNLFAKNANCINLQLAIRISKKSRVSDMHYPITDIQANFGINWPIRYQVTAKQTLTQTDGRTARQTDGRTYRQ